VALRGWRRRRPISSRTSCRWGFRFGAKPNQEQADVTDVLLSVLLSKGTVAVSDGAQSNDKDFQKVFPYLAVPHEGFQGGPRRSGSLIQGPLVATS
jgi:hypothetical protein